MNPADSSVVETERQALLQQLNAAETALRANLHIHCLDETGRAHMERALAHIRESYIAINEGRARSVRQLVTDLLKVKHLHDRLSQKSPPGVVVKSVAL